MANFKAPLQMVQVWTGFNGQLGHLYKLGDWKTAKKFDDMGHLKKWVAAKQPKMG